MTARLLACLVMILACALSSGCVGLDRTYRGHCPEMSLSARHGGGCGCESGCSDGTCGPAGCPDGSCHEPACGSGGCVHPFRALWSVVGCSSGCGEFYFDEWINDPPEECDPCDDGGRYVGPRHHCRGWFDRMRVLGGYRAAGHCDTSCGLACGSDCGEPGCGCAEGHLGHPGEFLPAEAEMLPPAEPLEPTPASTATRPTEPYYTPSTTRASYEGRTPRPASKKVIGSGLRR